MIHDIDVIRYIMYTLVLLLTIYLHRLGKHCSDLTPSRSEQLDLFASRSHAVAQAMDKINDKYGEFVQYASTHDGDG
jgi:hypothetical protein